VEVATDGLRTREDATAGWTEGLRKLGKSSSSLSPVSESSEDSDCRQLFPFLPIQSIRSSLAPLS